MAKACLFQTQNSYLRFSEESSFDGIANSASENWRKFMNRSEYFDFVERKLSELATRVQLRGGLNILNLHLHSENFYCDLLNLIYSWSLHNLNATDTNAAGIDFSSPFADGPHSIEPGGARQGPRYSTSALPDCPRGNLRL